MTATDELTIKCVKCGAKIKLTEAITAPLLEKERAGQAESLADERRKIREEEGWKAKHAAEREVAHSIGEATKEAENAAAMLREVKVALKEKEEKLAEAQREQARLMSKERELDDARIEMELTIARKVIAETGNIRQTVERELSSQAALRMAEKDEQLRSLAGQIDELKRRAEQGDNRVQGEAQEVLLEGLLKEKFPRDYITPVGKGVYGGDVQQQVVGGDGRVAGAILWESKRTKAWDGKWIGKLKTDQRAAGADLAVIVTQAMPDGSGTFDYVNGVWVVAWEHVYPAALALRQSILAVAEVRVAQQGQAGKAEAMYAYLTGGKFKARMQAVVERFGEMGSDLQKERASMTRAWAKREEQLRAAVEAAAGLVGDCQAIAGKEAGEIVGGMMELESGDRKCG